MKSIESNVQISEQQEVVWQTFTTGLCKICQHEVIHAACPNGNGHFRLQFVM